MTDQEIRAKALEIAIDINKTDIDGNNIKAVFLIAEGIAEYIRNGLPK